jgi:thiamine biosynthesis lipoprotein
MAADLQDHPLWAERRFRAMGSAAHVVVVGGPLHLADDAAARIEALEWAWSRFLPTSEVSALNAHAGHPVEVSPETALLVRTAITAWRVSGGSVDPTVLGAVVAAGYDRSFDRLAEAHAASSAAPPAGPSLAGPSPAGPSLALVGCTDIVVTPATVTVPAGTGFDPGGIGKGLAGDVVAQELLAAGADGACVNLGGDVRVAGRGPDGGGWTVAVEHPDDGAPIALLGVADGAVATSSTLKRRWRIDGRWRHHLIDPATGRPATTDLVQVTAVAAEGWQAEAYAKTVLLRGSARGLDVLPRGVEVVAVRDDGVVLATPGITTYTGRSLPGGAGEVRPTSWVALSVPGATSRRLAP